MDNTEKVLCKYLVRGEPWLGRTLVGANPGGGEPWWGQTLVEADCGWDKPWAGQTLGSLLEDKF